MSMEWYIYIYNMYKRKALSTCFRLNDGSDMFTHEEEEDDF